jgi:hypothetical protein
MILPVPIPSARSCNRLFDRCIVLYHVADDLEAPAANPYAKESIQGLLFEKCWVDTVQWHLEDLIRDPEISDRRVRELKRRIDAHNQRRTDLVERLDDWWLERMRAFPVRRGARLNSETPGWMLDRMSILSLKLHHMAEAARARGLTAAARQRCRAKLRILIEQRRDLSRCLDELIEDIRAGRRYVKRYRQMKMYNDSALNPVLRRRRSR